MMRIALLLGLLSLFSCTVTKRVHRPGYHIEWNKNYSKSERQVANEKAQETSDFATNSLGTTVSVDHLDAELEASVLNQKEEAVDKDDFGSPKSSKEPHDTSKEIQENTKGAFVFGRKSIFRPHESKVDVEDDEEDEKKEPNGEIISGIGVGLIILGVMLMIGSLFLVFGFGGLGNLFTALVFSGNGFVVGFLGFLLFILILLVIGLFVVIVEFVLGGAYAGFVVGSILIVAGIVLMLIGYLVF